MVSITYNLMNTPSHICLAILSVWPLVAGHWGPNKDFACALTPRTCNPGSLNCLPIWDSGCKPRSAPGMKRHQNPRQLVEPGDVCSFSDHPPHTPSMCIPGLEHMAVKTAAPCILHHPHSQADLTLYLCIRVHTAQVDPAINSWRAQALTLLSTYRVHGTVFT